MSRLIVCDASAVVAMLLDGGDDGRWATAALTAADLLAPSIIGFETANIIRRHELAGLISPDQAIQAHHDLFDLTIEEWPHELLADRAWELRRNLSIYDASYVALAELMDSTLVTLDKRIRRAAGVRCAVSTP